MVIGLLSYALRSVSLYSSIATPASFLLLPPPFRLALDGWTLLIVLPHYRITRPVTITLLLKLLLLLHMLRIAIP